MKTHLLLALEIIVCSGVWLAAYRLLLERRVRFTWCRTALLMLPLLSVAIPLLRIPVWPGEVIEVSGSVVQPVAEIPAPVVAEPVAAPVITAGTVCTAIYLLGTALILGVMALQFRRIRRLAQGAEVSRTEGCTVVRTRQHVASFSFLRRIYIWHGIAEEELPAIIAHERSHIRHHHSLERIAMETMKALLWWNPFVWIAARMLTEVEEYEADHDVLQGGFDRERYMHILFRQMFGYSPEIANSMRNSLTKKRFQMMTSHYSGRYALLRLAATLPAIAGLLCAFSFTTRAAEVRIVDTAETAQPTTHAIYLLNGEEVPVERIRPIDPARLTLAESYTEETMPAAYGDRGAQFLFSYTSDAPESRYTPIRIEGRLHFPDGSPAAGIAVCACHRFTQPFTEEGIAELGTRSDADGRFTVEGPAWGSLCFTGQGISGINSYNSDGAATMTVDEELPYPRTDERSAREAHTDAPAAANGQTQPEDDWTEDDTPFLIAETMPTFRGGDLNTFRTWVQSQITYPAEAQKRGIQGRVVLRFIVERDGSVTSCRVLQSPDESLSEEAIRVVSSATGWTGGLQRGIPVRVQLLIPIDFRMNRPAEGSDEGPAPQSGTPTSATAPTASIPAASAASTTPAADRGSLTAASPVSSAETPRFRRNNYSAFLQWLQMNIRYPQQALREKTYGRITVLFTINRDGKIEKPRIMGDKCEPFIEEVFRVLRLAPGWEPAAPGEKNSEGFAFLIHFMIRTDEGMLREPDRPARPLAMAEIAVVGIAS